MWCFQTKCGTNDKNVHNNDSSSRTGIVCNTVCVSNGKTLQWYWHQPLCVCVCFLPCQVTECTWISPVACPSAPSLPCRHSRQRLLAHVLSFSVDSWASSNMIPCSVLLPPFTSCTALSLSLSPSPPALSLNLFMYKILVLTNYHPGDQHITSHSVLFALMWFDGSTLAKLLKTSVPFTTVRLGVS